MRSRFVVLAAAGGLATLVAGAGSVGAADGTALVNGTCASCHNLTGPPPSTLEEMLKRKAPDLHYAGSKFNRSWLVQWLQGPTPIRRSGTMFLNHVVSENGKDVVPESAIAPCPAKLDADEAEAVADYLMTLKNPTMKTGVVDPSKGFSEAAARRLFTQQLPCVGCHTAKMGARRLGGVSGPDLSEAGKRLNPDWVYARIENPQYWDPKTWMPRLELSHAKRETLTLFIASMK